MTYQPVDWREIIKGHLSAFFAIFKNNNIPLLIANCVRLLSGSFNFSICVVYFHFRMFNLTGSLKQFCVCTLILSWLKKYQYSENKLPIEAQSRSLSLIYVSDMFYNVTTSINTYLYLFNEFISCLLPFIIL